MGSNPTPAAIYKFTPQPDITSYELAFILSKMMLANDIAVMPDKSIPENLRRHFTLKE